MENWTWHHPQTHTVYIKFAPGFSRRCSSVPTEICRASTWGVSISDPWAHLEVFRGERTQIHNGSPQSLPGGAQFPPPIINITAAKWGGGWNCVHVRRRKKKYVQSVSDALMVPHPALCPLTPFSIAWSACLLQYSSTLSDTFEHSRTVTPMCGGNSDYSIPPPAVSQSAFDQQHLVLVRLLVAPALVCMCVSSSPPPICVFLWLPP